LIFRYRPRDTCGLFVFMLPRVIKRVSSKLMRRSQARMTRAGRREEGILLTHLPSRCGGESRRAGREARHQGNLQRVCAVLGVARATFEGAPLALAGAERWPVLLPLRPARDRFGAGVS